MKRSPREPRITLKDLCLLPLLYFFDECCVLDRGGLTLKAALWQTYLSWAKADGLHYPLTRHEFTKRVVKVPEVEDARVSGGARAWRGIRLLEAWQKTVGNRS